MLKKTIKNKDKNAGNYRGAIMCNLILFNWLRKGENCWYFYVVVCIQKAQYCMLIF